MKVTDGWKTETILPVKLMHCMGTDDLVVDAARVSFAKKAGGYTVEKNQKLINYLWKHKHYPR